MKLSAPVRACLAIPLLAAAACGSDVASDDTTSDGATDAAADAGSDVSGGTDDTANDAADDTAPTDATTGDDTGPTGDTRDANDTATGDTGTAGDTDLTDGSVDPSELEPFSFFVTSLVALQELSGSEAGFGGDLRFGQTGPGAGLRGADLICATIAERSMPGSSAKQWRAFLSAVEGEDGAPVDAIDRIGDGPWYDRLGRTFALTRDDLLADRPLSADAAIRDDFPNEDGVPNHQPDPTQPEVDNHDMLTGSNEEGRLYSQTATCESWTSSRGDGTDGEPRVGHSWPRSGPGGGGPGGGGPGGDINMANWMSSLDEAGCAAGINLVEMGPPIPGDNTVGSGGGYGGFYCFALNP